MTSTRSRSAKRGIAIVIAAMVPTAAMFVGLLLLASTLPGLANTGMTTITLVAGACCAWFWVGELKQALKLK